jgi:hypothetical protein
MTSTDKNAQRQTTLDEQTIARPTCTRVAASNRPHQAEAMTPLTGLKEKARPFGHNR